MQPWRDSLKRSLVSGSCGSLLSSVALAACGLIENGHAAAPTNAISHWVWGERAMQFDRADWRHTALGYAIHHASSTFWALVHARAIAPDPARTAGRRLLQGALLSALACAVDYRLTPQRLRPGFERRLSAVSLLAVYAGFALGLAAGEALQDRQES